MCIFVVMMIMCGVALKMVTYALGEVKRGIREQNAIDCVRRNGGEVYVDGNIVDRILWPVPVLFVVLSGAHVTDSVIEPLQGLPTFDRLYIYDTSITEKGLGELSSLTSLRYLEIRGGEFSDNAMTQLRRDLPDCRMHFGSRQ
jgi:hypothetical protein